MEAVARLSKTPVIGPGRRWGLHLARKLPPFHAVIKSGRTYKQRPEFRGDCEQVVVFYSPCCNRSMHVFPVLRPGGKVEYPRVMRCRQCRRWWKLTLLFTRRRIVRSIHLTA